jgi:hypothetical protein
VPDDEQKHEDPTEPPAGNEPEAPAAPADAFRPEAIAARVDRLGAESDLERVARDEEAKLYERKKTAKTGGLESAASKRLARIGEGKVKRPSALGEGLAPEADPLVRRAVKAGSWVQEHQQTFVVLVVAGLLGFGGFAGYQYWTEKRNGDASTLLAQALTDERGHVSDKAADEDEDDTRAKPLYPTFKSAGERRDAALAKYREVESKYAGSGAAILARLAEASLLLDAGDPKAAAAAYLEVSTSALATADAEVRGRALEGLGFADEALATSDAGDKAKHLDDALAAYKKLTDVDVAGFKELGQYHQARVLQAQGDKAKAIDLLKEVQKRVSEPGDDTHFAYLKFVVEDRLRDLDPTALPPKARTDATGKGGGPVAGGPGGHVDMNDPQIKQLLEQLKKKGAAGPGPANGGVPPNGATPTEGPAPTTAAGAKP